MVIDSTRGGASGSGPTSGMPWPRLHQLLSPLPNPKRWASVVTYMTPVRGTGRNAVGDSTASGTETMDGWTTGGLVGDDMAAWSLSLRVGFAIAGGSITRYLGIDRFAEGGNGVPGGVVLGE